MSSLSQFFQGLLTFVTRAVAVVAGLVLTGSLIVAGLIAAFFIVVWSVLRGGRPPVGVFNRPGWPPQPSMPRGSAWGAPRGEVIDIQAREVAADERR